MFYLIRMQVLPTEPSPTTTSFTEIVSSAIISKNELLKSLKYDQTIMKAMN